jgi:basic membrane lipoprotein Med (substrate-binding protein (PBP1-ABC) superfamily)
VSSRPAWGSVAGLPGVRGLRGVRGYALGARWALEDLVRVRARVRVRVSGQWSVFRVRVRVRAWRSKTSERFSRSPLAATV